MGIREGTIEITSEILGEMKRSSREFRKHAEDRETHDVKHRTVLTFGTERHLCLCYTAAPETEPNDV